ncbi:MAG TPA: cobalamin-binding protein [Polyangia bacterium]|jgi:iron complex transport system substrate-binding protein
MRIVSLIASSTEIVCALGMGDELVGRSHECDFPTWVKSLPSVTAPKFPTDGTSYEIDERVKAIVQEGLAVYRVDAAALAALRPDVIITQSQCEVCAVSTRDVEAAVCQIIGAASGIAPRIVSLEPNALDDIWRDIARVAEALGVVDRGRALVAQLQARIDSVAEKARAATVRPTVACIEWVEPLMAAGNWMPTLVERAGGKNLFGAAGKHSPWMSFDELVARDPEVIVILPCGYDIARAAQDLPLLEREPRWRALRAVRDGRVFVADGNQYFNRPGPRVVESLEILAELVHPEIFPPRHANAYIAAGTQV